MQPTYDIHEIVFVLNMIHSNDKNRSTSINRRLISRNLC